MLEDNNNLDENYKDLQEEHNMLKKNIKFKNEKDDDLNSQRTYETNRIKLKEFEYQKLLKKFEKTKVTKRERSEEIKKLEAQNKQQEIDNIKFEELANKRNEDNKILNFENNELESKIKKMKNDIDKALQANEPAQMRKCIIDMCIQYLWND